MKQKVQWSQSKFTIQLYYLAVAAKVAKKWSRLAIYIQLGNQGTG